MSDPLPPPPGSQEPVTPENTKKNKDWWNILVATVFGVFLVASVAYGLYAWNTPPSREYPGRATASPVVEEGPSENDLNAMTQAIVNAMETDNQKLFDATIADIKDKTGCLAVAGGRVIVDPTDKAEVAEEASKRAQYVDSLESQGLVVGHVEWDTPEGHVHQVIGFKCN